MKLVVPAIVSLIVSVAAAASAGEVKLQIVNGRVTLQARDASAREILDEWARVGQVKIVNADKIAGPPLTLDLQSVPESQALNTVLRSVSGYVAAPRVSAPAPQLSAFDRIVVMAAPRPAATSAFTSPTPQTQPQNPFRGGPPPGMGAQFDDQDQPVGQPPVYPGGMPYQNPGGVRTGVGQGGLTSTPVPNQLPQGAPGTVSPMPTTQPTAPGMQPPQPGLGPAGTVTPPPRRPGGPGGEGGQGGD